MGETLTKRLEKEEIPPDGIISKRGLVLSDFKGIAFHSVKVDGTSYLIEGIFYDGERWSYQFLDKEGIWISEEIDEVKVKSEFPKMYTKFDRDRKENYQLQKSL